MHIARNYRLRKCLNSLLTEDETGLMGVLVLKAVEDFASACAKEDPRQITKDTGGWVNGRKFKSWPPRAKNLDLRSRGFA
jgi:hypothetical protein